MTKRVVYVPEEDVEYTFRRINKSTGKPVFETYRFHGEITESGRYILFETTRLYNTSVTIEHFSYRMRKQFVKQRDLRTNETYYTASRRTRKKEISSKSPDEGTIQINARNAKPCAREKDASTLFIDSLESNLNNFPQILFEQITEETGIEREIILDEIDAYRSMPDGPIKNSVLISIKNKWAKISKVTFSPALSANSN